MESQATIDREQKKTLSKTLRGKQRSFLRFPSWSLIGNSKLMHSAQSLMVSRGSLKMFSFYGLICNGIYCCQKKIRPQRIPLRLELLKSEPTVSKWPKKAGLRVHSTFFHIGYEVVLCGHYVVMGIELLY